MCPHHCADLGWPVTVRHASKLPHDGSGFSTDSSAHPLPLAQLGRLHGPRAPLARRRLGAATAVPVPMRSGYPVVQSGSETRGAAVFLVAFTDSANVTCAVFRHHPAQLLAMGLLTVHGPPPPDVIVGIVPEEQVRLVLLWQCHCSSVPLATLQSVSRGHVSPLRLCSHAFWEGRVVHPSLLAACVQSTMGWIQLPGYEVAYFHARGPGLLTRVRDVVAY